MNTFCTEHLWKITCGFYDTFYLYFKNNWTIVLDWDLFYCNQGSTLLEKSENQLELSVKQLVIQSSLASSISLDQTIFAVLKTKG